MSTFGTQCGGHEGAGVIVAVGSQVKNLKVGQRAGFKPIAKVCHTCEQCRAGQDNFCLKARYTGLHVDGKTPELLRGLLLLSSEAITRRVIDFANRDSLTSTCRIL